MKLFHLLFEGLKINSERAGKCFELAASHCMKEGGTYTIAEVHTEGKTFKHAFVDHGDKIYDPEYDHYFTKQEYEKYLHPKILKTMDSMAVSIFILKNKSFPYPEKFNL